MFRRETLELGPVPASEDCQQVDGINTDYYKMKSECQRYRAQLETIFPDYQQYDCTFSIKTYSHDFGAYMEVVIYFYDDRAFDEDTDSSTDYAFFVESNLPDTWGDMSIRNFAKYQSNEIARQFATA